MSDRKEKNIKIFRDTENMYVNNAILKSAVIKSEAAQRIILADEKLKMDSNGRREGRVVVTGRRTLEASGVYAKKGKKVCILNFASATNPGGGVMHGSSTQEESICRCSTLYPCLNNDMMWEKFYMPHRKAGNPLYNNDIIFTPKVKVFKSDTDFPEKLNESEWWDTDVITCAAPNLRKAPSNIMNPCAGRSRADISERELKELLCTRIERIFEVAVISKATVLILGAFGCGAFKNPPKLVAEVFAEYTKKYRMYFDTIEYAVFHKEHESRNFDAFFDKMKMFSEDI